MVENNPWKRVSTILHTKDDLPDALLLNGFQNMKFLNATRQEHRMDLKKKMNRRESTRRVPCVQYEYNTCQSIEDNQLILEKFNCHIPILYSGQHLDNLIPKDMLNCSQEAIKEGLELILKKETKCKQTQTCEMTRFTSTYTIEKNNWVGSNTMIWISFANPEVEDHHTYVSYDLISLIGEIGGILGLTLGASTLTLFELLFQHLHYY